MKIEGRFEAEALRILREIPGLGVLAQPAGSNREADATLRFADERAHVAVEFKKRANPAIAWQLVRSADERPGVPVLLIAGDTTSDARKILEEHGIAVIDGRGNAHIELPGLLFHVEGHRRPRQTAEDAPPTRLKGKAGVVAQALLLHRHRAWQVKELAEEVNVSTGLAHRVLARLEREGIMAAKGNGPKRVRRVTDAPALLDLWAEETVERVTRTPAHLLAQTPRQLIRLLGTNLGLSSIEYALTGAAAASLVAPFVTAVPVVEVWVSATAALEELYDGAQVDPVTDGQNVVFLQARDDTPLVYREQKKDLWLANRFRLYTDLRRDSRRGREQAENLRREVIGF